MLGQHIVVDLYGIDTDLLDNNESLSLLLRAAIDASGATYLGHKFEPQGCSGVILIAESHLAWHTWPEHNCICIDYFTCGDTVQPMLAIDIITDQLQPSYGDHQILERGRFIAVPPNRAPEPEDDEPRPRLVCIDGGADY